MEKQAQQQPDWVRRSENIEWRPEWVDKIPHLLHDLGDVFFPIPRGRKAHSWTFHMAEYRYLPDSEILNAYLESGWGYGIVCANNLVVVDVDETEFIEQVTDKLPPTAWQMTGSREGVHLFYECPGLNTRQILHHKSEEHDCDADGHSCGYKDGECVKEYEWEHLGEVKADPHGFVVGPGSVHPSGNIYGPLRGDKITHIEKKDLLDVLAEYEKPSYSSNTTEEIDWTTVEFNNEDRYDFYLITADDVFPWLEPNNRIAHPVHGSSTYEETDGRTGNFMKNDDGQTFICWRHTWGSGNGCGLNGSQMLAQIQAVEEGLTQYEDCEVLRNHWRNDSRLHWLGWKRAVEQDIIEMGSIPYDVMLGYGRVRGIIEDADELEGETYWDVYNALQYEMTWRDASR